ncbi:MAG: heavy metal translocating P-type ATPase, partial [Eubacteriales bacterium]
MHIKTILLKIAIGSALAGCGFWGGFSEGISFALVMAGYLVIGGDVLYEAASNVLHGDLFDENFLMGIATVGAFIIGESLEAIIVMLFYQIGEAFQEHAVSKSRSSITSLVEILPEFAVVLRDGTEVKVTPQEVALGELILVRAGEKIPLDGLVRKGSSSLDTKALTGESLPLDVSENSL